MFDRLADSFVSLSYFFLIVLASVATVKFLGRHLVKAGTACLVAWPVVGIVGGWVEWIVTGNIKLTSTWADYSFVAALVLYLLAFIAHIFFHDDILDKCDSKAN